MTIEMPPDYFIRNLALLKKHYPVLWRKLTEEPPQSKGELTVSPQGDPNLWISDEDGKEVFLHHVENPTMEVGQFLKLVPEKATGFVAFLGMGLGYAPLAFVAERKHISRMVIFELDEAVFVQAMRAMNLSPLIANPRVELVVGAEPDLAKILNQFIAALTLESIYTLEHVGAFALHPAGYTKLRDDFFQFANAMNVGGNTTVAFGQSFVENRFRQLSSIRHDAMFGSLHDAFAGVPAILVAAGPSLDKNIHLLAQAKGRAVIIAVDAAIPALIAHGIVPDFVASIDPQPITYEKYADYAAEGLLDVSLICPPWVICKVPKYLQVSQVYWMFSQGNMEKWLNSLLGGHLMFAGASTVAHLNLYASIILGCSPIVFLGQDLAFTDGGDHVGHTVLSNQDAILKSVEQNHDLRQVKGAMGGMVLTNRSFVGMIRTFEAIISGHPGDYVNATEGGAHLEGTTVLPLSEVIERYCQSEVNVGRVLNEKSKATANSDLSLLLGEFSSIKKDGKVLIDDIEKTDILAEQILLGVRSLIKNGSPVNKFEQLPGKLRKKIEKNDKLHGKIDRSRVWGVLQEVTMQGLRGTERMKVAIELLGGCPGKYLAWIEKSIERLQEINRVRHDVLADFLSRVAGIYDVLQEEGLLTQKIEGQGDNHQSRIELARHYMDNDDIRLARPILEEELAKSGATADVCFLLGKIAALQGDFEKTASLFSDVRRQEPHMEEEINAFLDKCAEEYVEFALKYQGIDSITCRKMLLKGFRYSTRQSNLRTMLETAIAEDVSKIEQFCAENKVAANGRIIKFWGEQLGACNLEELFSTEQLTIIYFAYGQLFFEQEDYLTALVNFEKAVGYAPSDTKNYIAVLEAALNAGCFDKGVAALVDAVALDSTLARYWDELGDVFFGAGRFEDALSAYEQCFLAMPENINLLRKIGDCYKSLAQYEAAQEAYLRCRQKTVIEHEGSCM
ncbi:MAG: DUF115 domain-containing protein [Proteobacteria bacterium]|nr:DUF115 domain-containing protein [Pseudomonadota bacterium]MBU1715787.1 DUF115 domain-containing protein [Pseudomonadota bacterium]